ncbi:sigma-E factor negative regulatory protein [Vibrio coralliirubri]|uniref:sigma-E factor negative regulatory protein n=1 Tax=Vibrio coralliirubri TaxID=1516159 RepID=UPI00073E8512|nr:sigma-E factor negative regulatory protein [Vibrio coralliirubri]
MADKEKLSALMDGETIDKALIVDLESDQESMDTWQSYHLIGDVMRGDAPETPEWNIANSVAAALENEPAHGSMSDNLHQVNVEPSVAPIEEQPKPQQAKRQLPAWLQQFGQVAVAACVSLAVVLGVQQYGGSDPAAPEQLPVLQTIPFAGSAEPVSLTRDSVEKPASEANLQEQRKRVHAMLEDYELQLRLNSDASPMQDAHLESDIE